MALDLFNNPLASNYSASEWLTSPEVLPAMYSTDAYAAGMRLVSCQMYTIKTTNM
jgi:hypothetical protein